MFDKVVKVKLGDLTPRKDIKWDADHLAMIDDVKKYYNTKKGFITISSNNKVLDGNHRYTILFKEYGSEYKIDVKQKPLPKWFYLLRFWLLFLLTWPLLIIYTIVMKYIKNKT
jgi:hypothetical protein